ncbi:MAG: amino acid ABC transporter substrate-binding protein [Burkholderiales bacterium]|nr:amino acid ABC transporter substrate-binding protein [Burkholderiales bacterium]
MKSVLQSLVASAALTWVSAIHASDQLQRIRLAGALRVCIWPDYYGVTYREPATGRLSGIDIDLASAFARELGLKLEFVDSSFSTLIADVQSERCDVAMFAIGVLPQRAMHLRFTRPYLRSGIYAITHKGSKIVREWSDIDRQGVAVGVQAGTFMEPVMAAALRHASLVVVRPPATREQELAAGRIDLFMTDYPYSRRMLDNVEWVQVVAPPEPFHPLPYAYAVKPGDGEWFQRVDQFVYRVQRDGRLLAAAGRHGLKEIAVFK